MTGLHQHKCLQLLLLVCAPDTAGGIATFTTCCLQGHAKFTALCIKADIRPDSRANTRTDTKVDNEIHSRVGARADVRVLDCSVHTRADTVVDVTVHMRANIRGDITVGIIADITVDT